MSGRAGIHTHLTPLPMTLSSSLQWGEKDRLALEFEKAGDGGLRQRLEVHTGPSHLPCQGEGSFEPVLTDMA